MSTSPSSPSLVPPSDGDASSPAANDDVPVHGADAAEAGANLGAADIAALLAASQTGLSGGGDAALDMQGYEGHVALALDPGTLAGIDLTLDLLTSSHQLFDVPVLDVSTDDVSPA